MENLNECKEEKVWKLLLAIYIYRISLVIAYIWGVSPTYYLSFLTIDLNCFKYVVSLVAVTVTTLMFPNSSSRGSTYLYGILYAITYVPISCYYWLNNQSTTYFLYLTCCFIVIELIIKISVRKVQIKIPNASFILHMIFIGYLIINMLIVVKNGGINTNTLSFDTVYAARNENTISGIMGYLMNWCAKACMPVFFAIFFSLKKYKLVGITVASQILLYLSTGFKSFIIALALLFAVAMIVTWKKKFTAIFITVLAIGNFLAITLFKMNIKTPLVLFSYRTLFIPAQGQYEYYDYFTNNPHLQFSEGFFGELIGKEYPYTKSIGFIVNQYIYGPQKNSNGNTGVFSYAFADMDFIGMLLAVAIIVVIFVVVDSLLANLPKIVTIVALSYPMIIMNDMNLMITLNTGGLAINILLLVLYSNVIDSDDNMLFRKKVY